MHPTYINYLNGYRKPVSLPLNPKCPYPSEYRSAEPYGYIDPYWPSPLKSTRFRRRTMWKLTERPPESPSNSDVPKFATWILDETFDCIGCAVYRAEWFEYFEIPDLDRLADHLDWDNLYELMAKKQRSANSDKAALEKELKVLQERQVDVDRRMIELGM